jgi:hypothetical protein
MIGSNVGTYLGDLATILFLLAILAVALVIGQRSLDREQARR